MTRKIFTLLFLISNLAYAQNCFSDFAYYRPFQVINSGTSELTDMQFSFDFDTAILLDSAKLQMSGADIRITDENCNPIPFYLSGATSDSTNTIWIKVPLIGAGDTLDYQIYYGNDTALSVASGDDTFIFFDDFSQDSVDMNKWEPIGEFRKLTVVNGILEYASEGSNPGPRFKFLRTRANFSEDVLIEFNARISNSNGFGFSSTDSTLDRVIFRQSGFGFDTMNQVAFNDDTLSNGISISQTYPIIRFPRGEFRDARLRAGVVNDTLKISEFTNLNDSSSNFDTFELGRSPMSAFHFILSSFIGADIFLDYIWLRKTGGDQLKFDLGDEVVLIVPTNVSKQNLETDLQFYPNPSHGTLYIKGLKAGLHSIKLFNANGQLLWNSRIHANETDLKFTLPDLANGLYKIQVSNGQELFKSASIQISND
ncbi:MAG: DUF2341 domain-containing protein [Bacteroidia bacterium]|nr:DUF2341 domain-containing protein [Bacteroidia bacterium]